jgi:histidyl-tRNA synthetase
MQDQIETPRETPIKNKNFDPVKGFKDVVGNTAVKIEIIIDLAKQIAKKYAAEPIHTPIVEGEWLFVKGVGNTTDIVTKEIFRLQNSREEQKKEQNNLILRPEQTSSIMRFALKNRLDLGGTRRFFSYGPMFRHENPQKGRWRQFNQFSLEFFKDSYWCDFDILKCSHDIIGAIEEYFSLPQDQFILKINSIGTFEERERYCHYLKEEIQKPHYNFTEKSKDKAISNALRVLDSKDPQDIQSLNQLLTIHDFFSPSSQEQFQKILDLMGLLGIKYVVDPYLVRGLDYYNGLVFEWEINHPNISKSTILGGGRYDYLASKLSGGKINLAAVGFSLGVDRIVDYIEEYCSSPAINKEKIIAIVNIDASMAYCINVLNTVREKKSAVILGEYNNLGKTLGYIGKNLDKYNNKVIILGSTEENQQMITLKNLQSVSEEKQQTIALQYLWKNLE